LNLSYQLANQYAQDKWKYQDSEALLKALTLRKKHQDEANEYAQKRGKQQSPTKPSAEREDSPKSHISIHKQLDDHLSEDSSSEPQFMQTEEDDQFTKLLGVNKITIETIYQGYSEKDHNVLELMKEHSHFLATHEGYPEYLTQLTHHSILSKNKCFKLNPWSQTTGCLDFYDSLDFITKLTAVTQVI
jgi:hypothetical protein